MRGLLNGLQSYYKLDETSGTRADILGFVNLTDNGGVGYQVGKIGNSADFVHDTTKYLSGGDTHFYNNFTISCWLYQDAYYDADIISKYTALGSGGSWIAPMTWVTGMGGIGMIIRQSSSTYAVWKAGNFTAANNGAWYHFAASFNNTTRRGKAYLNNVKGTDSVTTGGPMTTSTSTFQIGDTRNTGFDGRIDEVGIWNRCLDDSEVAALYNNGNGNQYPFIGMPAQTSILIGGTGSATGNVMRVQI